MLENERSLRLACFLGIFLLMAFLETLRPRRERTAHRAKRWWVNFGMLGLGSVLLPWVFPMLAVAMADLAQGRGWGLLNQWALPPAAQFILSLIILDFVIYLQHVLSHAVPLFWRLHRVHHTDRDLDASSALRFHPLEIVLSMVLKLAAIVAIGPTIEGVILFEVVLNGMAMFNHANLRIPLTLDRILRVLVVTPDMHRVHHSVIPRETDTNYGFNLSCWDRIFGTYRAQPEAGHRGMTLGIHEYPQAGTKGLLWTLLVPVFGPIRTGNEDT